MPWNNPPCNWTEFVKDVRLRYIVLEGKIFIEFEQKTEEINEGEMIVVPKGIKHKPYADSEAKIMIIEPKGVINTGDIKDKLTAPNDDWI